MKKTSLSVALFLAASLIAGQAARAETCLKKAAEATSTSEDSAKWFALETMVQAVSWGLWPSFVATGDVPGYKIASQKYKCDKSGMSVTCRGWATFCKKPS